VFKKFIQIITTLGLLLFGYVVYARGFAIVMVLVGKPGHVPPLPPLAAGTSAGAKRAEELAHQAFGLNHWTAKTSDLFVYYEPGRGIWLYAKNYQQTNGNRRLVLEPFAMAWRPHLGGPIKTLQAGEAVIDFDQPLEPGKSGAAAPHMVWAKVSRDIVIRNDKGTPNNPDDDMVIDKLTYLEFDEKKLVVESDSPARIKEKGTLITGTNLQIALWPKEPGRESFEPKTATLKKDIQIDMADAGQAGIVPGSSTVASPPTEGAPPQPKPVRLTCRGPMVVTLPRPSPPLRWGPPAPKGPTLAEFARDVVVVQGVEKPDQLNSDNLHLTFVPAEKPAAVPRANPADVAADASAAPPGSIASAAPPSDDVLGSLVLSKAHATGHAVWLQSARDGKSLCQELIYTRNLPDAPDETYLRADRLVWVERVTYVEEGPDAGKIQSVDTMETMDLTVFQYGPNGGPPTMVARGPGTLETRPDRTKPLERRISWADRAELQNIRAAAGERRKITLVGFPKVHSFSQKAKIEAEDRIIAYLRPNEPEVDDNAPIVADGKLVNARPAAKAKGREGDTMQIEWLEAHRNILLETMDDAEVAAEAPGLQLATSPPGKKKGKKTVKPRVRLDVVFNQAPGSRPKKSPDPAAAPPGAPAQVAVADTPPAGEAVAANRAAPGADGAQAANPGEAATAEQEQEPAVLAQGDTAWARVIMYPVEAGAGRGGAGKSSSFDGDLEKARLRGHVTIHQDPAPGKKRGTDVTADEVDMESQAEGLAEFRAQGTADQNAVVITDGFTIKGPFLGVDQAGNYAWSNGGPGELIEEQKEDSKVVPTRFVVDGDGVGQSPRSSRDSGGARGASGSARTNLEAVEPAPKDDAAEQAPSRPKQRRGPMTVQWTKKMDFWGNTETDKGGADGPGKAVFFGHVRAWTSDSTVVCDQQMVAMLDKAVSLRNQPKTPAPDPANADEEKEPEAKITWIKCLKDVEINRYKLDPETKKLVGRDQLLGDDVFYDVPTGEFDILGKGLARRYEWKPERPAGDPETGAPTNDRRTPIAPMADTRVRQTAYEPQTAKRAGRGNAPAQAKAKTADAPKTKEKRKAEPAGRQPARGPELTRITFETRSKGKFGGDLEGGPPKGPSEATFWGDVFVLKARVPTFMSDLDPDASISPPDQMRMTCDTLLVESTPIPPSEVERRAAAASRSSRSSGEKPETSRTEMTAWGRVAVQDGDKTAQGDRMTEDSEKGLVWLYGEKSLATITQQPVPGGQPSTNSGDALWYNRKTGNSGIPNARDINLIVDPRNERKADRDKRRLSPPGPRDPEPKRKPRQEPRLPPRADKERQGFRGR
jgi:hypothetical protein